MRKTMMAVAVAGALAAPGAALAQTSTVQIYGGAHILYTQLDSKGLSTAAGSAPKIDQLQTSDSYIGFRGEEALGGGLSAWFQCESTADFTTGGGGANVWCGRNSAVGLKGGWGNVFGGLWDTPQKNMITPIRGWFGFTNQLFGIGNVLENGASGNVGNGTPAPAGAGARTSWARRQQNTINYYSPDWSGFNFQAAYSATNEATGTTSAQVANKGRLWSLNGTYTNGPLYLGATWERHHNYNPAGEAVPGVYTGGNDRLWGLGGAYTFAGVFKVSAMWQSIKYVTTATTDMKVKNWFLAADWAISGPHSVKAAYSRLRDSSGTFGAPVAAGGVGTTLVGLWTANGGAGGTHSSSWMIDYAYAFSKRTTGYLGYVHVSNGANSRVGLPNAGPAPTFGGSQTAWGLGIRHSF